MLLSWLHPEPETWYLAIIGTAFMHVQSLHQHIAELERKSKLHEKQVPQQFQQVKDKFRDELAHQSNTHTPMPIPAIDVEKLDVLIGGLRALYGHSVCACLCWEPKIEGSLVVIGDLTYKGDDLLNGGGFGVVYTGDVVMHVPV